MEIVLGRAEPALGYAGLRVVHWRNLVIHLKAEIFHPLKLLVDRDQLKIASLMASTSCRTRPSS